jgi:hypothetical protein
MDNLIVMLKYLGLALLRAVWFKSNQRSLSLKEMGAGFDMRNYNLTISQIAPQKSNR